MKSLIVAATVCLLSLGCEAQQRPAHAQPPNGERKVAIVYLSRTNNTKAIADIEQYGIVFLGFPTWGMQLPPPMKSFLRQYSLRGKTVIPFNTNAGYGEGSSFRTVRELCRQRDELDTLSSLLVVTLRSTGCSSRLRRDTRTGPSWRAPFRV